MNTHIVSPRFNCKCKLEEITYGVGSGATKQEAKQAAAKEAYQKLLEQTSTVRVVD